MGNFNLLIRMDHVQYERLVHLTKLGQDRHGAPELRGRLVQPVPDKDGSPDFIMITEKFLRDYDKDSTVLDKTPSYGIPLYQEEIDSFTVVNLRKA